MELQRYNYSCGQYDATNTTLGAAKNNGQIAKIEGLIGGAKQWEQLFFSLAITNWDALLSDF